MTIVPDLPTYAPGDTAEVLVQAPFAPATGVVTVLRGGIVSTEAFEAEDGSAVLEIPIEEAWIPNVELQVDMVGRTVRVDDDGNPVPDVAPQPAFATGRIGLSIPPRHPGARGRGDPRRRRGRARPRHDGHRRR